MVDGAARPGSVLVLSHWPGNPTPRWLWRDLSVEIALAYLDRPRHWSRDAECVTIDHPDEDGLASLFVISEPETALRLRDLLVAFGRAGDFGVASRDAARAVFTFRALREEASATWSESERGSPMTTCMSEGLGRLEEILTAPQHYESMWSGDDARLDASIRALERDEVTIDERPEASLAIVRAKRPIRDGALSGSRLPLPIHPFIVHTATPMPRVLVLGGERVAYYDRYETWVRFVSRRWPLRRDLSPLADRLTSIEVGSVHWHADSPGAMEPVLAPRNGEVSSLGPDVIEHEVITYLNWAPVAWDPFGAERPLN